MKYRENMTTSNLSARDQITISASEYIALKAENETLKKQIDWLIGQALIEKKNKFGSTSEKTDYLQLDIFNEAEVFSDDDISEEPEIIEVKAHTKKKSKDLPSRLPDNLPVEVIECTLPEEDMVCSSCGNERHVIGKELARKEFTIIPATIQIK